MLIPQKQSITSTVRQLCSQIQTQINNLIKKTTAISPTSLQQRPSTQLHKPQHQRTMQELKNAIIQVLTSRLPSLINYQQSINDRMQDLTQQLDEWREKYKRIFQQFEHNQLQNDRLKIEIISLSQNYEQLSINYEQIKYKYHQVQERQYENRRNSEQKSYLDKLNELNLLSKDSGTNSASSEREIPSENIKTTTEMMLYEKEMFLQEIRASQKEIFSFKNKIEELIEEKESIERVNEELEQLLEGEKVRSDRFDREILDILNKNQQLKLEALQKKEVCENTQKENQKLIKLLEQQKQKSSQLLKEKDALNKSIMEQKQSITQLKCENSQQRQSYSVLEQKQRNLKQKISEMNKQNEQLRIQLEKMIIKLNQVTQTLQRTKQEEVIRYKNELQEQRSKNHLNERQYKAKNHEKVQEISKMHKEITHKLEQKIHLLERGSKQKKEKAAQLKYEVQRLYESLQIQVQKQFKNAQKIKELTQLQGQLQQQNKSLQEKLSKTIQAKQSLEQSVKTLKFQLHRTSTKLKKTSDINTKFVSLTLPKIKQQLHSTRLLCQHFCTMIDMQKQQTTFLLTKKQEHFKQLIEQTILQKSINKEQTQLSHQNQLSKWKQNCKNYEQKYDRLMNNFEHLEEKHKKLEILYEQTIKTYDQKLSSFQEQTQKKRQQQTNTIKTIEKLKEKCKQVEQYYKLVEDLSKQNMILKNKLQTASYYSFKSPEKLQLDNTSKRQKFTSDEHLQKYSKTTNLNRLHQNRHEQINMNDLTAKAQFQRMRLQAAKRQYNMLNRVQ